MFMLLVLLSRFSRVRLCDPIDGSPSGSTVPGMLQPPTREWVAISFSNAWKWKSESEVTQSCPTVRDPMDCSLPGLSIHGIFQARVLEWGAIAFSVECLYFLPNSVYCYAWSRKPRLHCVLRDLFQREEAGPGSHGSFRHCYTLWQRPVWPECTLRENSSTIGRPVTYGLVRRGELTQLDSFLEMFGFGKLRYWLSCNKVM